MSKRMNGIDLDTAVALASPQWYPIRKLDTTYSCSETSYVINLLSLEPTGRSACPAQGVLAGHGNKGLGATPESA